MSTPHGGPTLLVGLGGIGMGYDYIADVRESGRGPVEHPVRTHAAAISACKAMELVGGLDPHPDRRAEFASAFGRPAWASLDEIPALDVQTLVLAVPTSIHVEVAEQALAALSPRLLLCEKPAGMTGEDTRAILSAAERTGTALVVNYFRPYLPAFRHVRRLLVSGALGELVGGSVLYSHGLRRNGSHFVALCLWLFGDVDVSRRLEVNERTNDPTFELRSGEANLTFSSLGHGDVRAAELCLGFSEGLLRMDSGGYAISWTQLDPEAKRPSYGRRLVHEWEGDMLRCQLPIYEWFTSPDCTRQEIAENNRVALRTQEIIDEVLGGIQER